MTVEYEYMCVLYIFQIMSRLRFDIFQIFVTVVVAATTVSTWLSALCRDNHFPGLHLCHFMYMIEATKLFHSSSALLVSTIMYTV